MKIGIDFGTCNSVVARWDENTQQAVLVDVMRDERRLVPSCVAISRQDPSDIYIGVEARLLHADPSYFFCTKFKMLLNVRDRAEWQRYGWPPDTAVPTPHEVSKHFLGRLLSECVENFGGGSLDAITHLVLSAPAIWVQQTEDHRGREALLRIAVELLSGKSYAELEKTPGELRRFKGRVHIIGEPVAACCYFAHVFKHGNGKNPSKKPFAGDVLVCDYGGGTLDLSHCKIADQTVTVLDSRGFGHVDSEQFGAAGVAYDEKVLSLLLQDDVDRQSADWNRLMKEFEDIKVACVRGPKAQGSIRRHLASEAADEQAFPPLIAGRPVRASHLVRAFNQVIEPVFRENVGEMVGRLVSDKVLKDNRGRIDADPSRFRVLFVGGFCHLPLVEIAMTRYFGQRAMMNALPELLNSVYPAEHRKPSVALGAALVASEQVEVKQTCPVELGMVFMNGDKEDPRPLVSRGDPLDSQDRPRVIYPVTFDGAVELLQIIPYMKNVQNRLTRMPIKPRASEDIFPNANVPGTQWRMGFMVDNDLMITMWVQDMRTKEARTTSLGDLIARHSRMHVAPE